MIYLIFVQYIKHDVYATDDFCIFRRRYISVCNLSTCLKNSQKVKASAEHVHLWYKHKLADIYAIHWYELHQWLSAAAHIARQLSTASVRWRHGSSSEHCCIDF